MSEIDLTAFLTPDGRWNLLQDWLDENPRHKAVFELWLRQTPDESFPQIREVVAEIATKKYGALGGALVRVTQLTPDIRRWIDELKTLYTERLEQDHARKTRRIKRKSQEVR